MPLSVKTMVRYWKALGGFNKSQKCFSGRKSGHWSALVVNGVPEVHRSPQDREITPALAS